MLRAPASSARSIRILVARRLRGLHRLRLLEQRMISEPFVGERRLASLTLFSRERADRTARAAVWCARASRVRTHETRASMQRLSMDRLQDQRGPSNALRTNLEAQRLAQRLPLICFARGATGAELALPEEGES
jgi:hypothetical protein